MDVLMLDVQFKVELREDTFPGLMDVLMHSQKELDVVRLSGLITCKHLFKNMPVQSQLFFPEREQYVEIKKDKSL